MIQLLYTRIQHDFVQIMYSTELKKYQILDEFVLAGDSTTHGKTLVMTGQVESKGY